MLIASKFDGSAQTYLRYLKLSLVFAICWWSSFPIASVSSEISSPLTKSTFNIAQAPNTDSSTTNDLNIHEQKHINAVNQRIANDQQTATREQTAKVINQVPGVHITADQLKIPEEDEITGFHPIKKLLQPIIRLEKNTVQLQQQIMKLEGPIAGLQKPMLDLHTGMGAVQGQLTDMQQQVHDTNGYLKEVDKHVMQLQVPILSIEKPLANVAGPLSEVRQELVKVEALIATVLATIVIAAIGIAIGTPIAAVLIYRNRKKIFPDMREHEFPVAKVSDTKPSTVTRLF